MTTPLGAEGIDLGPAEGLFVEASPERQAARCSALLADPAGTRRLGERARGEIRCRLAGPVAAAALEVVYAELGDGPAYAPRCQGSSAKPSPQSGHSVA